MGRHDSPCPLLKVVFVDSDILPVNLCRGGRVLNCRWVILDLWEDTDRGGWDRLIWIVFRVLEDIVFELHLRRIRATYSRISDILSRCHPMFEDEGTSSPRRVVPFPSDLARMRLVLMRHPYQ